MIFEMLCFSFYIIPMNPEFNFLVLSIHSFTPIFLPNRSLNLSDNLLHISTIFLASSSSFIIFLQKGITSFTTELYLDKNIFLSLVFNDLGLVPKKSKRSDSKKSVVFPSE